jgi:hypothetical protein
MIFEQATWFIVSAALPWRRESQVAGGAIGMCPVPPRACRHEQSLQTLPRYCSLPKAQCGTSFLPSEDLDP